LLVNELRLWAEGSALYDDTGRRWSISDLRITDPSVSVLLAGRPSWPNLARELVIGDGVAGPVEGLISGLSICRADGSVVSIHTVGQWGVSPDSPTPFDDCDAIRDAFAAEGIKVKSTAAGSALTVVAKSLGKPEQRLPARFRAAARRAIHTGPCVVFPGAPTKAPAQSWHYDRSSAYLRGMGQRFGVVSSLRAIEYNQKPAEVIKHEGCAGAVIRVKGYRHIPRFPIHTVDGVKYPVGLMGGYWPIRWLRENDADIVGLFDGFFFTETAPLMAQAQDRFTSLLQRMKAAGKAAYTRATGSLIGQGWLTGQITGVHTTTFTARTGSGVSVVHGSADVHAITHNKGVIWEKKTETDAPFGCYRPDIGGLIAADNALNVLQAIDACDSPHLAHVDAVWSTSPAPFDGSWRLEREGPLRVFGVGRYAHNEVTKFMGVPRVNAVAAAAATEELSMDVDVIGADAGSVQPSFIVHGPSWAQGKTLRFW
jgi:hypothetical protein